MTSLPPDSPLHMRLADRARKENLSVEALIERWLDADSPLTSNTHHPEASDSYKQAVEQSPASIMITDVKGNITYVNPKFTEVTGYRFEEVVGQNPRILKTGYTSSEEYENLWKTIASGGVWRGEFHNKKRDGSTFWENVTISGVRNERGEITHFVAVKEEITEQKLLFDALQFVAQGAWDVTGHDYLEAITRYLAQALDFDEVFIAQLMGGSTARSRMVTRIRYNQPAPLGEYDLAGTPCENIVGKTSCCYPQHIQQLFPQDKALAALGAESYAGTPLWGWKGQPLGHIVLLHSKPMTRPTMVLAILQTFAMRIAYELERAHAEQAVRESEQFAYAALDSLAANICVVNGEGIIVATNRNWRHYAQANNATQHTYEGASYFSVCRIAMGDSAENADLFAEGLAEVLKGHRDYFDMEYPCHTPTAQRWFVGRITRFSKSGPPMAVIAHTDITPRKQAELALAASEQRYRIISELISDYAFSYRVDEHQEFHLEWITDSVTRVTGYTPQEAEEYGLLHFYHPDDCECALRDILSILNGKDNSGEYRVVTKQGEMRWMRIYRMPIWDDVHQRVVRYYGVAQDITAQKAAEAAHVEQLRLQTILQQEQVWRAAAERLLKVISHELRSPLTTIATSANILQYYKDQISDQIRNDRFASITRQVWRMNQTIDDLIMLIRGSIDRAVFQPAPLNLEDLCQRTIADVRETIGIKHRYLFKSDNQIARVMADENLISRILVNLLSNATKYSPHDTEIGLELRRVGEQIVLSVVDHGIGISQDDQAKLFDPFFRASNAAHIGGTGLGLNIVKDCVEMHNGTISVESSLEGGATFIVRLPYVEAPADDA